MTFDVIGIFFENFFGETFSFGDRVIIQVLGQAIKEDLSLTDLQLGLLSGLSFALLYSCVGFPIARMVPRELFASSAGRPQC